SLPHSLPPLSSPLLSSPSPHLPLSPPPSPLQKLLAEAKTKSLKGELMPGYEDDTVEQPDWLEPSPAAHRRDRTPVFDGSSTSTATAHQQPEWLKLPPAAAVQPLSCEEGSGSGEGGGNEGAAAVRKNTHSVFRRRRGARGLLLRRTGNARSKEGGKGGRLGCLAGGTETGEGEGDGDGESDNAAEIVTSGPGPVASGAPSGAAPTPAGPGPASTSTARDPREKLAFEFLWDDRELSHLAEQSPTFQRLKSQLPTMGRNPRLSDREFERQLQQLCVMIEERVGEITGRCDLNHGAYFRDPRILRVVAHFIEKRELPEWSKNVDGDIWRWNEHLNEVHSLQLLQMSQGGRGVGGDGGVEGSGASICPECKGASARLKTLFRSIRGGSQREGGQREGGGHGFLSGHAVHFPHMPDFASGARTLHLPHMPDLASGARTLHLPHMPDFASFGHHKSKAVGFGAPAGAAGGTAAAAAAAVAAADAAAAAADAAAAAGAAAGGVARTPDSHTERAGSSGQQARRLMMQRSMPVSHM
ncbi:unnamed protein product, partial [Closterium sp. NIES-53]